jgi:hypothetical protein
MTEDYIITNEPGKLLVGRGLELPPSPKSTIVVGRNTGVQIDVDKKFNWFQKKMIKWCFCFEVKEYKDESKRSD